MKLTTLPVGSLFYYSPQEKAAIRQCFLMPSSEQPPAPNCLLTRDSSGAFFPPIGRKHSSHPRRIGSSGTLAKSGNGNAACNSCKFWKGSKTLAGRVDDCCLSSGFSFKPRSDGRRVKESAVVATLSRAILVDEVFRKREFVVSLARNRF